MVVPIWLIFLPFLVAFGLATWQYCQIDPRRRVFNLRFGLMLGATAADIGYPIYVRAVPNNAPVSWVFLALALFWLASAYYLLRRMPPRDKY